MNIEQLKQIIADAPDGANEIEHVGFESVVYINNPFKPNRSLADIRTIIEQEERIAEQDEKIEKLNNDISVMIQKAASKHLPAYREQGQKMLLVEEENQALKARAAELEKLKTKELSFSDYEMIVDINNHNYGRYEALIDGNYIIGCLDGDEENE